MGHTPYQELRKRLNAIFQRGPYTLGVIHVSLRKSDFISKEQKTKLRWVRKHLGDRQHDKIRDELYDSAIAGHTYINT
jgi:hypothetical protein